MPLAVGAKNAMLDYFGTIAGWVSAHTGDPGATGASESSGSRVAVTWAASADGVLQSSAVTLTVPAGTYSWLGFWSASTGGTYRGKIGLPSPLTFTGSGPIPLSSIAWDLNSGLSA